MKIGIWTAEYFAITGQALVTARVVDQQSQFEWAKYIYRGKAATMVMTWLAAILHLWIDIMLQRTRTLYLVCSRSNGGFLRDVPALLAAHVGVRVIVHVHGSDIIDLLSKRPLSPLARLLYSACELIVPSRHLIEPVHNACNAEVHLCENYFLDKNQLSRRADIVSTNPLELVVLWNSNLMASKGFFDLATAVQKLREGGLHLRLLCIGVPIGDDEMSERETGRRLETLKDFEWFDYRGKVSADVASVFCTDADVVCLPSRYSSECQPLAIVQAICSGKTILVSDTAALRATVGEYPARFVPVHSATEIMVALSDTFALKRRDPIAFSHVNESAMIAAQDRFSSRRFDKNMHEIIRGKIAECQP